MKVPWWVIGPVLFLVAVGIGFAVAWGIYKRFASTTKAADGKSQEEQDENSFWFGLGYSGAAAAAAILIPLLLWAGLLGKADSLTNASIVVTLVVIASVIGLLAVLMMTALAFSSVKLSDSTQALGLPEGSVRAVIALSLIVIFVIVVVFLFGHMQKQLNRIEHLTLAQTNAIPGELVAGKHSEEDLEDLKKKEAEDLKKKADEIRPQDSEEAKKARKEADKAAKDADAAKGLFTVDRYVEPTRGSEDFAKQIITTISTLVVSISAFYFGSTTAISAAKSGAASGAPVITKQPADLNLKVGDAAKFSVGATGSNLSYQWQKMTDAGTNDISGAINNTYGIAAVTMDDNASKFSCKITNPTGTTLSNAATLTVTTAIPAAKNGETSGTQANTPGGSDSPGVPDNVSIGQVGANSAEARWAASPRATNYRPFKKVDGVDADFVALPLTSEMQVLLENVPAKAVVYFQVTAHNDAGESARSAVVSVTLS
jgi:hypothetical protein